MQSLDFAVLNFIYEHGHNTALDIIMPFISWLGNGSSVWLLLAAFLLIFPKSRKVGVLLLCSLMLEAIVCNSILKPLFARVRPCDINTAVHLLINPPHSYSFPSGHTAAAFTAVSALYFSRQSLWRPALILALLIAFSRLYLYVHYPTDVLGGIALGILIGYMCYFLFFLIRNKSF